MRSYEWRDRGGITGGAGWSLGEARRGSAARAHGGEREWIRTREERVDRHTS